MNKAITPIMLAKLLEKELKPITTNNVPPQMIYNYLKNNVRKINSFATKIEVANKEGKIITKTVFEEEKALEFIEIMKQAAIERKAKKEKEANES
jgi:hypothetical protein